MQKKILFIEDEENLVEIYLEFLNAGGFDVRYVKTVEAAKTLAKKFQADLLLVDHGLAGSGLNGINGLPNLRKWFPQAALILFSNYTFNELKKFAKDEKISKNLNLARAYWCKVSLGLIKLMQEIKRLPNMK